MGKEARAYLCDDDEICPAVRHARRVERALCDADALVGDGARELGAHALDGLDGAQLGERVLPVGVCEQRTREDACA